MGPSIYVWFMDAKQRLLDRNNRSLCVPDITCRFVHALQVISTRITCLYISQPFPLVFACKTAPFEAELQVSMGTRPHLSLVHAIHRD